MENKTNDGDSDELKLNTITTTEPTLMKRERGSDEEDGLMAPNLKIIKKANMERVEK